jgi:hypothetical protein
LLENPEALMRGYSGSIEEKGNIRILRDNPVIPAEKKANVGGSLK